MALTAQQSANNAANSAAQNQLTADEQAYQKEFGAQWSLGSVSDPGDNPDGFSRSPSLKDPSLVAKLIADERAVSNAPQYTNPSPTTSGKGKSFGSLLEQALPLVLSTVIASPELGLAADLAGATGGALTAGEAGAALGAGTGGIIGGITDNKNPLLGVLEGAGEGAAGSAASNLIGSSGIGSTLSNLTNSSTGTVNDVIGGVQGAATNAATSALKGGSPSLLGTLTSGLSGAAGAAQGTPQNETGAAGGDIDPVSGAPVGSNNPSGVTDNNPTGTYGDINVSGASDNISGNGGSNNVSGTSGINNIGGLTNGLSNISGSGSDTNNGLLKDASGLANIGQLLSGILGTQGAQQPDVIGTNQITTPITSSEASGIKDTGNWTDRQLYDGVQAIQQRYQRSGQSGSPQEQAEIQALLTQQVG